MRNLKSINPENYEYLWTDYDVNFIFTDCYLFKQFRAADIVLIYDWQTKGLHFFLSKNFPDCCADGLCSEIFEPHLA